MNSTYCTLSSSYCRSWSTTMSAKCEPDAAPNLSKVAKNGRDSVGTADGRQECARRERVDQAVVELLIVHARRKSGTSPGWSQCVLRQQDVREVRAESSCAAQAMKRSA